MNNETTVACIHGGTRGIGARLVARLLAASDFDVVVATGRSAPTSAELDGLRCEAPARLVRVRMDIEDEASIAAAAAVTGDCGTLRLVINAAGLLHDGALQPEKRLADLDPDALARSFRVNAIGHALVAKHFVPLFPRKGRVVLAGISARVGSIGDNRLGGWYGYRASKAAQNMLLRTTAIELARLNRQAVCVSLHPGTTETELSRPFSGRVPTERLFTADRAAGQLLDVLARLTPEDSGGFFAWDGSRIDW